MQDLRLATADAAGNQHVLRHVVLRQRQGRVQPDVGLDRFRFELGCTFSLGAAQQALARHMDQPVARAQCQLGHVAGDGQGQRTGEEEATVEHGERQLSDQGRVCRHLRAEKPTVRPERERDLEPELQVKLQRQRHDLAGRADVRGERVAEHRPPVPQAADQRQGEDDERQRAQDQRFADVADWRAGRKVLRQRSKPVGPDRSIGEMGRFAHCMLGR